MAGPDLDLQTARATLRAEGQAIAALAGRLDEGFARAVELLLGCEGQVVLTGIGKAGLIARIIGTVTYFCSTLMGRPTANGRGRNR